MREKERAVPLYEYECAECGERFERLQKFSDPPIEHCPKCSGHVSRLLSSPAIQFKGSGWYVTDYARPDKAGARRGQSGSSDAAERKASEAEGSTSDKSEATEKPAKDSSHTGKTSKPGKKKD